MATAGVGWRPSTTGSAAGYLTALASLLPLPLPVGPELAERWLGLAEVAAADLSVARLFEGHTDALAILAEGSHPAAPDRTYGVWASQAGGTAVTATVVAGGDLVLDGTRPYASGASSLDTALLTVDADAGPLLVAVDLASDGVHVAEGSWQALGMGASDSTTVHLRGVRVGAADVVGPPGFYLQRPGFWPGAVGVAACWFGGAVGVVQPLVGAAVEGRLDAHGLAHLGQTWADLEAAAALLAVTAGRLAGCGERTAASLRLDAETVRSVVERVAVSAIDAVARSLGPGPLTGDRVHAQRVADLGVYVRQHHAERDHAELGRLLGERRW